MRAAAKAPMPTWWPSISTVVVPSGEAAVIVPELPLGSHTTPMKPDATVTWEDREPEADKSNYYYVRVEQTEDYKIVLR